MNRLLICVTLLVALALSAAAEVAFTKRSSNYVREGPGAYAELIAVVPENTAITILAKEGSWLKVKLSDKKTGWLSANSLTDTKPAGVRVEKLESVWSSPKASRAGVSAAIRGFAEKRDKTPPGSVEKVLKNSAKTFRDVDLAAFRKDVEASKPGLANVLTMENLELGPIVYDAGIEEQQVGLGIAARLIEKGFINNRTVVDYVNMICATLAANSPVYDWDFTVFILDDSTVNGFALPGGYVFVTKGAVQMCADEAELAAIIAHEMAHVIRKHGMQEMSKRKVHIKADEAFNELEEETGEKTQDEAELDDLVQQTYEKIVAPRLLEYEIEADQVATVLLSQAGYDPKGLVRIGNKVARLPKEKPGIFDPNYMAPDYVAKRAKITESFVQEKFKDAPQGATLRERFVKRTSPVR
jgi:beta-barrel assembly-enhancing protease